MTTRQEREAHFHDEKRGLHQQPGSPEYARYSAYQKWYSVAFPVIEKMYRWMDERYAGKLVLDYGCGEGEQALRLARSAGQVIGIDISGQSIEMAREKAKKAGLSDKITFVVGDVEALNYPADTFDGIWCSGVLHHLDVNAAFGEMARVLKPDGGAICNEALGHNVLINLYRRTTPHLRSDDEHPLKKAEVEMAGLHFGGVDRQFHHFMTLASAPFHQTPLKKVLFPPLRLLDRVVLNTPGLRWQAWQVVMMLTQPKKSG